MCLAQGPQWSDAGAARTRGPSVSSQALYHWAPIEESECFDNSLFWLSLNKDNTITYLNIFHGTLPKIELEDLDLIWREWMLWKVSFPASIEQRQYNYLSQNISWDITKDWAWGPWPHLKRVNALKSLFSGFHRTKTIQLFISKYFMGHYQRLSLRNLTSFEESECFDNSLFRLSSNKDNTIIYLNIGTRKLYL